jgi:hypothetical protein
MVECSQQLDQVCVVGSALDRQGTLGGGGQHEHRVQRLGDVGGAADPRHAGSRQDDSIEVGLGTEHPRDAAVDVAADRRDLQL